MPDPPHNRETYNPVALTARYHRQAVTVWSITLAIVGLWTVAVLAAPVSKFAGDHGVTTVLYTFFSYICHQLPERSFYILGEQFGVCSRCFGVYLGIFIGAAVYPLWRGVETIEPLPRFWLFLSLIPISIDWGLTAFGIWENTHLSRFITGTVLGFVCATFIIPAVVEVTRNIFPLHARR